MDSIQEWHKGRDRYRFNTGDKLKVTATGEIGVIKCLGSDCNTPTYFVQMNISKKWVTVKENEVESALKNK